MYMKNRLEAQVSLKCRKNVISTEALSIHRPMAATVERLSSFIKDVTGSIGDTNILCAIDTLLKRNSEFDRNERKVLDRLSGMSYADIKVVKVPCSAGLIVPWLKYLHDLDGGIQFCLRFYEGMLGETTRLLAEIINSPDKMEMIARRYSIEEIDFERMTANVRKDISGPSKVGEQRLGVLLERCSDMPEVVQLTNSYAKALFASNQDLVTERVSQIKRQLNDIADSIVDPNVPYRMSGRNIDQLSKIAFNVAQAVEYYGVIMTLFTEHRRTFEEAIKRMSRL